MKLRPVSTRLSLPGLCRALFGGLALALLTLATGCAPAPADQFVAQADVLQHESLAAADVPNRDLQDYVQQVGQRIAAAARIVAPDKTGNAFFSNVQFHLVDTKVLNVFETGGRHIYVYNGLFQFCQTEEELAAAMAHAYAHLVNLDVEKLGMQPDTHRGSAAVTWQFVNHRFTAEQQAAADKLAYQIYATAGWDPARLENLWQRLQDRFPGPGAPDREPANARAASARAFAQTASLQNRRPPVADRKTFVMLRNEAMSLHTTAEPEKPADVYLAAFPNLLLPRDGPEQQAAQDRLRPIAPAVKLEPN